MIIEFRQTTNNKDFGKLDDGAVFELGGDYYIKMAYDIYTDHETFNAVDLENGYPAFFENTDEVIEYPRAKTVIE